VVTDDVGVVIGSKHPAFIAAALKDSSPVDPLVLFVARVASVASVALVWEVELECIEPLSSSSSSLLLWVSSSSAS
jgi:hypothetical protein